MPLWDKSANKPKHFTEAEKRNVVATDLGWVRRVNKTNEFGGATTKDEIIVAIGELAGASNMGFPDITQVWHSGDAAADATVNTWISFDEPIFFDATDVALTLNVANTVSGNAMVAISASDVYGSNNTLLFQWTPSVAGTYKVEAQTLAGNGTSNLLSLNEGNEAANLVITGTVSNNSTTVVIS